MTIFMKSKYTKCLKLILGAVIVLFCGCVSDDKNLDETTISEDFENRCRLLENTPYLSIFDSVMTDNQRNAMQFLYAYMPLPDITDYSGEFHLKNVDYALRTREEMPWGKSVPDREFMHFVLPLRVNNENMDECREVFFKELKDRVKGLSMYDAVLEVNHWCHEKVTYTPSDSRTSSPLATVRTAHGRCGEESTFTVSALRSVGIPARQVYTPRWAHTDNNHAWVEAWVDGQWYFLGACEPEPVLNLGWFNAPASRAMLMHTNVFGRYNGPEEVLNRNACYTEINVTSNYAPVATTSVMIVDENGMPVNDAIVEFKIYNYAEFYTAATKVSDRQGLASLTTGCGDMLVWASKEGKYGFAKVSAGKDDKVKVVLDKNTRYEGTMSIDIVPPAEGNMIPALSEQQIELNKQRFAREDSIRNAYVATFPDKSQSENLGDALGIESSSAVDLFMQSRGNYATLVKFIAACEPRIRNKVVKVLFEMSEKDRRDVTCDVLCDHLPAWRSAENEEDWYYKYVLNPRVSNERLTCYRSFFASVITPEQMAVYKFHPEEWAKWCRDSIGIDSVWNPRGFCMSPCGVWQVRIADPHSRDIFFVAGARSMGIAARIDEVTGKTQYTIDGSVWHDVAFDEIETSSAVGSLIAGYETSEYLDNPRYYSHFTISRIVDGRLVLQNHPEEASWETVLREGTNIDAGDYLVTTGTRMADGSVLAHMTFLTVAPRQETQFPLTMRHDEDNLQVIGDFNSENLFYDLASKQKRSLLSVTGRGYYILALIDPNSEPSNHFLRDMMPYKEEFEEWGQKIVLLFDDANAAARYKADDFLLLPSTVIMGTDIDGEISRSIKGAMKLKGDGRPVIIVADTFNRVVFVSQGYSIGLGERLVKIIKTLQE